MTKIDLKNKLSRAFHNVEFNLKKNSPEILITVGVIGVIASTVIACKSTTKLKAITDKHEETMNKIKDYNESPTTDHEKYTELDYKKDVVTVNTQTAMKIAKLYAPAVILGGLSITGIFAGNNIHRKRNIALAAAYTAVDGSFKQYRKKVVERFGDELDKELKYGIKAEEVEVKETDKDGKEVTTKKVVNVVDPNAISEYARFYDDGCNGWTKSPEKNLWFLKLQQNWANERLKSRGYLFLNEVYESLGIPASEAGNVVGWIYDDKDETRDNFVDFGIYDVKDSAKRNFVNGTERCILLDFNVDGPIWNNKKFSK